MLVEYYRLFSSEVATPTARHIWDVPLSAIDAPWVKVSWLNLTMATQSNGHYLQRSAVLGTIYGPAMWFAKAAFLTRYLRLFNVVAWMWWSCHAGIWFLACAYWSLVPVSVIYNFPHGDEHWDLAMSLDSAPAQVAFVTMGLISVVSDLYILILPSPILLKLQISLKRKLGLCLVFITAAMFVFPALPSRS